ncbi:RNA polymerase recycling motor HelD [Halalkalibacter akibai]|uniref:DNA 3'-5' helicase n=1 Tax=Halalkalibacter akibai (strain ATCC 43226 / DSM 21942 / CIP 109018 / JCM 9157 / 1139) TaxID=1236973 RepID=W4QQD3_HALA3|nr:RNA polymerase recycling motor HelD [Halalkalibacter akibai]GAE34291.1 ATP-dependent DNA helicase rep [Halalkalibacter akibai JCM 9157]
MSKHPEWRDEQQRVDFVVSEIEIREKTLKAKLGNIKGDVIEIRKNFWDDVTVNLDNAEEAAETFASIKQQAELMSERERSHRHDVRQLKNLHKLKNSPYFGRIDFVESGESQTESIYIGTASFVDQEGIDFYVYDWRAPISSLYYDYGPGQGSYATPSGLISGEITLKKQFIIRNGEIKHLFHTGITIGDELLQEVLGNASDSQMKSIVATIQKEQNQIIRNEKGRLLIVQGVAGSGKTSAALQRIAYLLYRYRDTLLADEIVLFSPNPLFNSYISTVLPELGEENMQQTTFQDYLEHRLGEKWTLEDPFSQMEYVLTSKEDPAYAARIESIKVKSSLEWIVYLDQFISSLEQEGLMFNDITFRGRILFQKETIYQYFYELDADISIPNRMNMLVERLLREVREFELKEKYEEWVEQEVELLDSETLLKVHQKVEKEKQKDSDDFYEFDREQELLQSLVIKRKLKIVRKTIENYSFLDVKAIYLKLFQTKTNEVFNNVLWPEICFMTIDQIQQGHFLYEDATPYLYLKGKLEGFHVNTTIKHVFIDEAQDYSPFQFAFIKNMFPRAKWSVLGDFNQSIYVHSKRSSFTALESLFEPQNIQKNTLTQSYRSTRQIIDFAKHILDAEIDPFNRSGDKPTIIKAKNEQDLNQLLLNRINDISKKHKTIAVICKTARESELLYKQIQNKVDVRLITKNSTGYESGIVIIPSYLAKGVEFDAVIVFNVSETIYNQNSEPKLLYTVCTRAMHSLDLLYRDKLSPLLTSVKRETYHFQG